MDNSDCDDGVGGVESYGIRGVSGGDPENGLKDDASEGVHKEGHGSVAQGEVGIPGSFGLTLRTDGSESLASMLADRPGFHLRRCKRRSGAVRELLESKKYLTGCFLTF